MKALLLTIVLLMPVATQARPYKFKPIVTPPPKQIVERRIFNTCFFAVSVGPVIIIKGCWWSWTID